MVSWIAVPLVVGIVLGVRGVVGLLMGGMSAAGLTWGVCLTMQVADGRMQRNCWREAIMAERKVSAIKLPLLVTQLGILLIDTSGPALKMY